VKSEVKAARRLLVAAIVICSGGLGVRIAQAQGSVAGDSVDLMAERGGSKFISSTFGHNRLVDIVQKVLFIRIASNLHGYEDSPDFLRELGKTYSTFLLALDAPGEQQLRVFERFSPNTIVRGEADSALRLNEHDFLRFYEFVRVQPGFRDIEKSEIKEAMLAFSLLVYMKDPVQWQRAKRMSYFWPACRRETGN
jgi:hypothetical protein